MSPHEVIGTVPGNSTTFRTQADEHDDHEEALQNLRTGKYEDWPNEAAFDGLTEERGPIKIAVTGNIPTWAAGSLYRTGPGLYKIDTDAGTTFEMSHWFDGLAHTHRFDIIPNEEGSVDIFYSSRRQAEEMMDVIKKQGTWPYYSFGQKADPCLGFFAKAMAAFKGLREPPGEKWHNNINVAVHVNPPGLEAVRNIVGTRKPAGAENDANVLGHRPELPKSIWVSTDNSTMKQIDPQTLEPIGWATQDVLHPELTGAMSCAHAQRDPETGDFFNFNLEFGPKPTYRVFRVDASSGKTEILATIREPSVSPAYIHSLFLSPSFVILCIPTSHFGLSGTQIPWERNLVDAIKPYDPSRKTQWIVIDRKHSKGVVARFETDGRFFFHTVNSFEEKAASDSSDINLYCDVIDFGSHEFIHSLYLDVILNRDSAAKKFYEDEQRARNSLAHLTRYHFIINPDSPATNLPVTPTPDPKNHEAFRIPAPHAGEIPTINPLYATRKHRYVYSLPFRGRGTITDAIVKTDTVTREALFWDNPKGHTPGEAIFVPRPGGEEEDDGVLLSLVLDGEKGKSYLLCLDAKTMAEMGRAEVDFAIALGFHGAHVPSGRTLTRVEGPEY
ncbi:hypothetical protein NEUTE1DRAFT_147619 [Neurospora tetrasperma FGSC 2508]|uniref:Carotenoid oxygenase n=1 Tax=Neurospora tetrasperma (strain FGSC 2508 / ATCC MYA-4615 / P0657) TaxID=510951 RepID=F8MRQ0_NEUT8|nr:uncharacterized protein NEUTE1DRAFT_147619 [Neurospora tetrasperma FGSC 2508]EGO54947.1 hypothetical protein NEUTE1DRAFT_147619 [Neurospora tetrasperma FGSC 2508]EGZ69862.1 hypothetical protein NEUTE2DRAFT_116679 [Neurospora tetrasperma FGSC 2509]